MFSMQVLAHFVGCSSNDNLIFWAFAMLFWFVSFVWKKSPPFREKKLPCLYHSEPASRWGRIISWSTGTGTVSWTGPLIMVESPLPVPFRCPVFFSRRRSSLIYLDKDYCLPGCCCGRIPPACASSFQVFLCNRGEYLAQQGKSVLSLDAYCQWGSWSISLSSTNGSACCC